MADLTARPRTGPVDTLLRGVLVGGPLVLLALVAVLAADVAGSGALVLRDAGAVARRGAPVATMVADLAAAMLLGGAVLAGWVIREDRDRSRALLAVAVAAAVTTLARGVSLLLSYAIATGQSVGTVRFGSDLGVFVRTDLGTWLLAGVLVAALTTTVAVSGTRRSTARVLAVLAGVLAFCAGMTGHAAGDAAHEVATSTMFLHLLAVGLWVGGLAVLQLLPTRTRDDVRVLAGYSHLALVSWAVLGVSGVWALAVRMTSPTDLLTSAYVQIGAAKALLLLALGVLGVLQRRQIRAAGAARGTRGGGTVGAGARRLALLELGLMGLAVALAAAMSSSPPPADAGVPPVGAAGLLTGYPLPPAPDLPVLVAAWRPDPFALGLVLAIALLFWRAGAPARGRAETLRLLGGVALVLLATNGAVAVYAVVLVSAHLGQHLALIGAGLLLGSVGRVPTVLVRAVGAHRAAGPLLAALPVLAMAGVYATGLLRVALESHPGHLALLLLAVTAGATAAAAVRCSPLPVATALAPVVVLLAGGTVLVAQDVLLAASWFGATGRPWGPDALGDQHRGGVLVLIAGGAAAAAVAVAAAVSRGRRPRGRRPPGPRARP